MIEHYVYPEGNNSKEKILAIQFNSKEYNSLQFKDYADLPKEYSVSYPRLVIGASHFISTFVIEDGAIQDYDFQDAVSILAVGHQDSPINTYNIFYGFNLDSIVYYCRKMNYSSLEVIYYSNSEEDSPFIEYYGTMLAGTHKNSEKEYRIMINYSSDAGKSKKYIVLGNYSSLEDAGIKAREMQELYPNAFVRELGQEPHRFYNVILGQSETISGAQELLDEAIEKGVEDARISYV